MNRRDHVVRRATKSARIEGPVRKPVPGDRVAVVASWGEGPTISRSLARLIEGLESEGYPVILVRASDDHSPLQWPHGTTVNPVVVRKENYGYDFGSWSVGLSMFPSIARRSHVLLLNDSMVGPFAPLTEMIASFEASTTDAWGATSTRQFFPHLQSYLLGFTGGVLADSAVRQFWRGIRHLEDKSKIIGDYEIGFSRLLASEGLTTSAWFASERVCSPTDNPVINGWSKLIDLGFPFIKREVVCNPSVVSDARLAPAVLRDRYGIEVAEWL